MCSYNSLGLALLALACAYVPYHLSEAAAMPVVKRPDFLNFLADSWQTTGSLRNAIREIQDMTESKRALGSMPYQGPRLARSDQEEKRYGWATARVGKRIPHLARMG